MSSRQRTNRTQEKASVVGPEGDGGNQFSDKTSVFSVRNNQADVCVVKVHVYTVNCVPLCKWV